MYVKRVVQNEMFGSPIFFRIKISNTSEDQTEVRNFVWVVVDDKVTNV